MYDVHNFWFLDVTSAGQDRPQKDEGIVEVETNVSSCTPCNEDHNTPPEIPTRKGNYDNFFYYLLLTKAIFIKVHKYIGI